MAHEILRGDPRRCGPPQPQAQRTGGRTIFASSDDDGSAAEPDAEPSQRGDRRYDDRPWTPLSTIPPAARLVSIPDDGGFVRLADGTLWEVYPPDRTLTDAWHAGDYITVSLAPAAVGDYDHVLVDTKENTRAHVRFVDVVGRSRHRDDDTVGPEHAKIPRARFARRAPSGSG